MTLHSLKVMGSTMDINIVERYGPDVERYACIVYARTRTRISWILSTWTMVSNYADEWLKRTTCRSFIGNIYSNISVFLLIFSPTDLLHVVGGLFSAISSVILYSFMFSLMISSHRFLGLPLLMFPCTYIVIIVLVLSSHSFLNKWSYNRSRFFVYFCLHVH